MTAKEYLSQAYRLDQRINAKLAQVASLNELATKCTATLTVMPGKPNHGSSTMADAVCKIIGLQEEINQDIDRLVDLKRQIRTTVDTIANVNERMVLRYRYIHNMTWEQIGRELNVDESTIRRWHKAALSAMILPADPIKI